MLWYIYIPESKIHGEVTTAALQLIEVDWRTYASVKQAIIDSDNAPFRRQAIICANAAILSIRP